MNVILFDYLSPGPYSRTFAIDDQVTIVATGMQPGDFMTFEVLQLAPGQRGTACGCYIGDPGSPTLSAVEELQCPACETDTLRPVRLTDRNPVVVLDSPQDAVLRAVYHGTGLDLHTVTAWASDSKTPDLTDAMRGCPPVCCEDEPQTWIANGIHRCAPEGVYVQEVSNCGNLRWVLCGALAWTPTGAERCDETNHYIEETNQCGQRRWTFKEPLAWTQTGQQRCNLTSVERQEVNQCGDLRWSVVEALAWVPTGQLRCVPGSASETQIEETNQCGDRRWVPGPVQDWQETGQQRCTNGAVERQQQNQCGGLRWTTLGPETWVPTGVQRCSDAGVLEQQQNQCGNLRWMIVSALDWRPTGLEVCQGSSLVRQEEDQCGRFRWVDTGVECEIITPNSTHAIVGLSVMPASGAAGAPYCWTVTLDAPVEGSPLVLVGVLSGAEQTLRNYPPPTVVIAEGSLSGILCVPTAPGTPGDPDRDLCLDIATNARITNDPASVCATVVSPAASASTHTATIGVAPSSGLEGSGFTFTVTLDAPVAVSDLALAVLLSGTEQDAHGYATPRDIIIPIGQTSGSTVVTTVNDQLGGPDTTLTGMIGANPRLTGGAGATASATVTPNAMPVSTHTATIGVAPTTAPEGAGFTYTVTLNAPVSGGDLTLSVSLSGSEQAAHSYASPRSITIPNGATSGSTTVITTNDAAGGGDTTLTATIDANARLTGGVGASASATVTPNAVPPSMHNASIGVAPSSAVEGSGFTFTVTLDAPVTGGDLLVNVDLSGSEQAAHGYATPRGILIPNGSSSGTTTVNTLNDAAGGGNTTLTGTIAANARLLSGVGASASATVTPNAAPPSTHTASIGVAPTSAAEGSGFTYTVTLNAPVSGGDLTLSVSLSGSEQAAHSYASPRSILIPNGATSGFTTVATVNDASGGGNTTLTATIDANARLTGGVGASASATVTPNAPAPPLDPGDVANGDCYVDTPSTTHSYLRLEFSPDGFMYLRNAFSGVMDQVGPWKAAGPSAAEYEARVASYTFSGTGTSYTGPAVGTWANLGALVQMEWGIQGTGQARSAYLNAVVELRRVGQPAAEQSLTVGQAFISVNVDCP